MVNDADFITESRFNTDPYHLQVIPESNVAKLDHVSIEVVSDNFLDYSVAEANLKDSATDSNVPLDNIKFNAQNNRLHVFYVTDKGYGDYQKGTIIDDIFASADEPVIHAVRQKHEKQTIDGSVVEVTFVESRQAEQKGQIDQIRGVPYDPDLLSETPLIKPGSSLLRLIETVKMYNANRASESGEIVNNSLSIRVNGEDGLPARVIEVTLAAAKGVDIQEN